MSDMTDHIWTAFHCVSKAEQKQWLQSVLDALKEQDEQIQFYKHAWFSLARLHNNPDSHFSTHEPI